MNGYVRCVTREKWKMWSIFYCTVMVWHRRERRWKVKTRWYICVVYVDKACENGRVRREVERLYRKRLD